MITNLFLPKGTYLVFLHNEHQFALVVRNREQKFPLEFPFCPM